MVNRLKYVSFCVSLLALAVTAGCSATSSASSSAAKPTKTAAHVHPSGYGSLVETWDATHIDDWQSPGNNEENNSYTGQLPNYNPDHSLPLYGDYDPADTYTNVIALDGRVVGYTINLHLGTALTQVLAIAASQLPKDTRRQWVSHQNTCVQARYVSATLARQLGHDDPQGAVFIQAEDSPPSATAALPDPKTFTDVSLSLGTVEAQGASPGECYN